MLPLGLSGNLGGKAPKPLETPFQTQSPSHYHNLLTLQQGCHTPIMPDPYPYLLPTNCTIYHAQQELGWVQLYYGHMLPLCVTAQTAHHPTINGLHCYVQALTNDLEGSATSMAVTKLSPSPSEPP